MLATISIQGISAKPCFQNYLSTMDPPPPTTTSPSVGRFFQVLNSVKWTILLLFLLLSVIVVIAWLIKNPREPGFRVSSLSVSNFSATDSQLRGNYQIHLNITNPNKKIQVRVDHFMFFVSHDGGKVELSVAHDQPPCIYVDKMSNKDMKIELSLEDTPPAMLARNNNGGVKFNLEVNARVTYEDGIWPAKEKFLDVYCDVGFLPMKNDTAKLLGVGNPCQVVVTAG